MNPVSVELCSQLLSFEVSESMAIVTTFPSSPVTRKDPTNRGNFSEADGMPINKW
jgi:hypothetical protein